MPRQVGTVLRSDLFSRLRSLLDHHYFPLLRPLDLQVRDALKQACKFAVGIRAKQTHSARSADGAIGLKALQQSRITRPESQLPVLKCERPVDVERFVESMARHQRPARCSATISAHT